MKGPSTVPAHSIYFRKAQLSSLPLSCLECLSLFLEDGKDRENWKQEVKEQGQGGWESGRTIAAIINHLL